MPLPATSPHFCAAIGRLLPHKWAAMDPLVVDTASAWTEVQREIQDSRQLSRSLQSWREQLLGSKWMANTWDYKCERVSERLQFGWGLVAVFFLLQVCVCPDLFVLLRLHTYVPLAPDTSH